MSDDIASRFYDKKHFDKLKIKVKLLGINYDAHILLGFKIVVSILLLLLLLVILKVGYIVAPLITLLFYFSSEYFFIDRRIRLRKYRLESDALEFFPIFLGSLNGGRNIKKAIMVSTEIVNNELSLEFKNVLHSVDVGKSLDEALNELKERIPSSSINNIILSIILANDLGNSINDTINRQLDLILLKKKNYLLKKAKRQPFILSFFCLVFFLIMLLVINVMV